MAQKRLSYFFLTTLCALSLEANPSEPTVTAGHATYTSSSQKLEVTAHDKTIISWKDFSIGSSETTRINLPSSHSVILNRVESNNISKIEGLLSSNGIVYLINPNGILITSSGKIDTAGFLASTLNITDQDFLNGGDLLFKGSGFLTNLGTICCNSGDVVLMASTIKNEGSIQGETIALGAGQEILMTLKGDERLTVRLAALSDSKEEVGIHQTGTLESVKAELKADGNLYTYAINNEGIIHASTTVERAGKIYLVADKGHVTSSGTLTAPGGEVRVLGNITSLTDKATVDVSGDAGGGTILVGGDYQGKNPDILNAMVTYAGPDVVLSASSLQSGSGGKVIAWADGETRFYGKVNAKGGPLGGDGGFTEISGIDNLDFRGIVDLTAPKGVTGTLLLDPANITLSTGGNANVTFTACPTGTYVTTANNAVINIANLLTNLASTCNISIVTTPGVGGTGTITVANPIDWTGTTTNTLTVTSLSTLTFNAAVTNETTAGTMTWNSGATTAINAAMTNGPTAGPASGAPAININSAGAITQAAGGPILNNSATGTISLNATGAAAVVTLNGTLTSNSSGLTTVQANAGTVITASTITFNAGSLLMEGVGTSGAVFGVSILAPVIFNSPSPSTFNVIETGSGGAGIRTGVGASITIGSGAGPLTMTAVGNIQLRGDLISNSSSLVTMNASVGNFANFGVVTFNDGSLLINGVGTSGAYGVQIQGPMNFNSPSPNTFSVNESGSTLGITSTAAGIITIGPGAGPLTMTAADSIGMAGALTSNSISPVTIQSTANNIITSSTITFNQGSLLMEGVGTPSAYGVQMNGPLILNSPSPSTFQVTESGGNVFGIVTNQPAGPITIGPGAGPLTMTAVGQILIGGTLTSNSISPVTIQSTASSVLNHSTITFNDGSLLIEGVGTTTAYGVAIQAPVNFNSPTPSTFNVIETGGNVFGISTIPSGPITVGLSAGPLTMTAVGSITISGMITYNTNSTPFPMTSTAGDITIQAPIALNSTALLDMTATTGNIYVLNRIRNSAYPAGGPIHVTCAQNLQLGYGPASASALFSGGQIGSAGGNVKLSVGGELLLAPAATSYAQIGFDTAPVNSNLIFTNVGGDVNLTGGWGTGTEGWALIGHGSPIVAGGALTGNITFANVGGNVNVQLSLQQPGNGGVIGAQPFAQIGHTRSLLTTPVIASGDINMIVAGSISVTGEISPNSYALIGHGGGLSGMSDTYMGNIILSSGANINAATRVGIPSVLGVSNTNSFAAIGHSALMNGAGIITINSTLEQITAAGSILLQSQPGNVAIIGPYVNTMGTAGAAGNITVSTFNVQTGPLGNLTLSSVAPAPGQPLNGSIIGAVSCTGSMPLTAAGTATGNLTINSIMSAGDILLQTGSVEGTGTSTLTLIQGGTTGGSTTVTSGGSTTLLGGNNIASISSAGPLTLNSTGSLTLLSSQQPGSSGAAQILSNGATSISAFDVSLTGFIGGPSASIQNSSGNLSVTSTSKLITLINNAALGLTGGAGTLTVTSSLDDLVLQNIASIMNQGSGSTAITVGGMTALLAGLGNASITNGTGPLTLNVTGNLNLVTNTDGSAFITSNGPVTITAENMNLSGLGAGQQSYIFTTAGNLLLIAQNNITLADNSLVQNSGGGALTLVVDNQAPASAGPGRFILLPNAMVGALGPIRIFTSEPNGIAMGNLAFGQVDGRYVTFGLTCAFDPAPTSLITQYNTFYPSAFGGIPYTIFFKIPAPAASFSPANAGSFNDVLTALAQQAFLNSSAPARDLGKIIWTSSEMFWFLRRYFQNEEPAEFVVCTEKMRSRRLFPKNLYPVTRQNWTLYPIEFKTYSNCEELAK